MADPDQSQALLTFLLNTNYRNSAGIKHQRTGGVIQQGREQEQRSRKYAKSYTIDGKSDQESDVSSDDAEEQREKQQMTPERPCQRCVSTRDESLRGSLAPPWPGSSTSTTSTGSLAVLNPAAVTISRDATDGTEQGNILSTLFRHCFLGVFVRDIKYSDRRLQAVLKLEPDDLNSLYVYEAKMSLLTHIAQTCQGAERLIEATVLPTLAIYDFLDTCPDVDSLGHFLPSVIQQYHQLFLPGLQLVDAIMVRILTPPDAVAPLAVLLPRPKATHGQFAVFRRLTPLQPKTAHGQFAYVTRCLVITLYFLIISFSL
ncbi:hypothetical protein EDB83DRAFT_2654783 [Lactarius deliciosus]|nr:hypothetical protein EDB83DRAFT_2654783 [Lactarius deliciosus]